MTRVRKGDVFLHNKWWYPRIKESIFLYRDGNYWITTDSKRIHIKDIIMVKEFDQPYFDSWIKNIVGVKK